jgi:NaMN:DMB phosphoribosyltransferase
LAAVSDGPTAIVAAVAFGMAQTGRVLVTTAAAAAPAVLRNSRRFCASNTDSPQSGHTGLFDSFAIGFD